MTKDGIPRCLFGGYSNTADGKAPGYYGESHCAECHAYVLEGCAAFDAAVARGEFNAQGFTPKEWERYMSQSFTDRVEALFRQHPGEWIDARTLMATGGICAWRSRVAECRTQRGLVIRNRQRKAENADGKAFTISEYLYESKTQAPDALLPTVRKSNHDAGCDKLF